MERQVWTARCAIVCLIAYMIFFSKSKGKGYWVRDGMMIWWWCSAYIHLLLRCLFFAAAAVFCGWRTGVYCATALTRLNKLASSLSSGKKDGWYLVNVFKVGWNARLPMKIDTDFLVIISKKSHRSSIITIKYVLPTIIPSSFATIPVNLKLISLVLLCYTRNVPFQIIFQGILSLSLSLLLSQSSHPSLSSCIFCNWMKWVDQGLNVPRESCSVLCAK